MLLPVAFYEICHIQLLIINHPALVLLFYLDMILRFLNCYISNQPLFCMFNNEKKGIGKEIKEKKEN